MTLRHLKIFIMVADCGSMTAASAALFIAQPTVSQAISELESHYGVKLFDRLSKHLYITDAGKQMLGYARHITRLVEEMDQMMKNPDAKGGIKVGASLTVGSWLMPSLVNSFNVLYPSLKLQTIVKNTKDIESMIINNMIDFAVVEGVVHHQDIVSDAFMDDEVVLVCGRSHALYHTKAITEEEASKLDYIVREPGSGTRELFESIMALKDISWQMIWECNGSDGLKSAAINGIGAAVISKRLVERELRDEELAVIPVNGIKFERKFSIIYHKNKYLTESMKTFFKLCKEAAVQ